MNKLIAPSTDFRAVRDGRNSQVFYVDVALDTARSAAAGTGLVLPISGNSFYCDANPTDGNAFVHFQDTNFDRGPVPLYVSPGVIFNIPYTKVLIENSAQPGKKIRITYGVDIDFQPGSVAQLAVSNVGGYTAVRPEAPTGSYNNSAIVAANTATQIFAPGANVNGAIILAAYANDQYLSNAPIAFLAKASAPANINDGDPVLMTTNNSAISGQVFYGGALASPQYVPAGLGLYWISLQTTSNQGFRACRYKLL